MNNLRKLALVSLLSVALVAPAMAQKDWSASIDYATDGHAYSLGRIPAMPDALIRPDWKSVFWNFGLAAGRDLTDNVDCAGGSVMVRAQGSSGFFAGITLNALSKTGVKGVVGQASAVFGWSARF